MIKCLKTLLCVLIKYSSIGKQWDFFHIGITCLWPTLAEGEESNYNEISELFDFHTLQFGNSAKAMKFGRV